MNRLWVFSTKSLQAQHYKVALYKNLIRQPPKATEFDSRRWFTTTGITNKKLKLVENFKANKEERYCLEYLPDAWPIIAQLIPQSKLKILELEFDWPKIDDVRVIADAIQKSKIQVLHLWYECYDDTNLIPLLEVLPHSELQEMTGIQIRDQQVCESFVKSVPQSKLQRVGMSARTEYMEPILDSILKSSITQLTLGYDCDCGFTGDKNDCCCVNESSLLILSRYINRLPLKSLEIDLYSESLGAILGFIKAINKSSNLQNLQLIRKVLNPTEWLAIGKQLSETSLTGISLRLNSLTDKHIANEFGQYICSSKIRKLHIKCIQEITDDAFLTLAESLANSNLEILEFYTPARSNYWKTLEESMNSKFNFQVKINHY